MILKNWAKLLVMTLFVGAILIVACDDDPVEPVDVNIGGTLNVGTITPGEAIQIDGIPDATWDKADDFNIVVHALDPGARDTLAIVSIRALSDGVNLYMIASWRDTADDLRPDHWLWIDDRGGNIRTGGQDYFYAIFDDQATGDDEQLCWAMCHSEQLIDGDTTTVQFMKNDAAYLRDAWIWKSGETDPLATLYDLYYPADDSVRFDESVQDTAIRVNLISPINEDPLWMHKDTLSFTGDFLLVSESTDWTAGLNIDGDSIPDPWPAGSTQPGFLIADALVPDEAESRFEVVAKGNFDEVTKYWTLEMKRELSTGHTDDVQFISGQRVRCTIGVSSNPFVNNEFPHYASDPFTLQF